MDTVITISSSLPKNAIICLINSPIWEIKFSASIALSSISSSSNVAKYSGRVSSFFPSISNPLSLKKVVRNGNSAKSSNIFLLTISLFFIIFLLIFHLHFTNITHLIALTNSSFSQTIGTESGRHGKT